VTTIKHLVFPVSITSDRLELKTRWWHRALVVFFFVFSLPAFVGAALLALRIAKADEQASYLTCVERGPLLTKEGMSAVLASHWEARVTAYDSFFSSKSDEELQPILHGISLSNQVKADLWNAKYATTHPASVGVSAEELTKYNYLAVPGQSVIEFPSSMTNKEVNAEMAKKFNGAQQGWMDVDTPEGFTVALLKDGTALYLHSPNLSPAEAKRRVEIYRASPAPQTLPVHFFDKKSVPVPKGAAIGRLELPPGHTLDKTPGVIWDVESPEEVTNPFQVNVDVIDMVAAQTQRDNVRSTHEWESCKRLSPSRYQRRNILIAILGVIAGSYLLQGLYRALLYVVFG
jgi:hypothetical protein